MGLNSRGRGGRVAAALAIIPVLLVFTAPVRAAGLTVTTTYPTIEVDPGGTATFPLTVTSSAIERVDLTVTGTPADYKASFRGGGSIVDSVTTTAADKDAPALELQVKVPATATPGNTTLTVTAKSSTETITLPLDVKISDTGGGQVSLSAQTPALRGSTSDDFSFSVTLSNDTAQEVEFTFAAQGPAGWTVDARPSGAAQAATAVVAAGGTSTATVTAKAPADAAAGVYPLAVSATGGSYQASTPLQVELTGSYSMQLATSNDRLNTQATAGTASNLSLKITNTGSAPLVGVTVTGTPPADWKVTFDPPTVATIAPQGVAAVTAIITPASNAVAGDYVLTFTADAAGTGTQGATTDTVDIRTTVETSSLWGFVGLALIAFVVIGLLLVFRRYGRR
jgi:uncharacterized membrane protein